MEDYRLKVCCEFEHLQVKALEKLIDRLDFQTISGYADTVQEAYDMVLSLQRISEAIACSSRAPRPFEHGSAKRTAPSGLDTAPG
jgi:hypothetical protein